VILTKILSSYYWTYLSPVAENEADEARRD